VLREDVTYKEADLTKWFGWDMMSAGSLKK